MSCKNHYPIIGNPLWEVTFESHDWKEWTCKGCGNTYGVKQGYGEGINIISESYEKRLEAARPLVQPFRDGVPSAEYVALTGGKNMSKEDIKKARPVWQDVPGLKGVVNNDKTSIKKK